MEPSKWENMGSVTPYRFTRSRTNSESKVNSALHNDSPTTLGKVRITRGKSQEIEKHVSTPMPSKTKGLQSLKNVSLTKLKSKLLSVDASIGENVIHEEGDNRDNAEVKEEKVLEKHKSTEVVQNGLKENKISGNVPDHLNDDAEPSILKVVDQSNGALNSKKTSDGTESVEEPVDLQTQHSIAKSNLPDLVDSLKSKSDVESTSVQDEPATEAILSETVNAEATNLFYTPMESSNDGTSQTILDKFPSTANKDVKKLAIVSPSEFVAYPSSDGQPNNQSVSNNEIDIPVQARTKSPIINSIEKKSNGTNTTDIEIPKVSGDAIHQKSDWKPINDGLGSTSIVAEVVLSPQSTRPSIRQNNKIEQSVQGDEGNLSLMFSDDEGKKAIQDDSMDVTGIEENNISVGDMSSCSNVSEVKQSETSLTVSETSMDFLAGTRNGSDINQKIEHKAQSEQPNKIEDINEKELESLETKPRKILKAKRRSDIMTLSREVKTRLSLHPNVKLSSGQMKKHDVSDNAQTSTVKNVEDSAKCQSKQPNNIDDASKELENMSAERMSLHPSTLIKSADSKTAYTMIDVDSSDEMMTEIMKVDQFLNSAETPNIHTSSESEDEISEQLKDRREQELKAKKESKLEKDAKLIAAQLLYKKDKKSKEIPENDTSKAFKKSLATSKAIERTNRNTTEPQITTVILFKRDLKRKMDTSSDEDNLSIMKPEMKKLKMLQSLETSTPKIENWRMKRNPTRQYPDKMNSKKNLRRAVGTKKVVSKTQWTTSGPFMVTKIPAIKILMSL